MYSSVTIPTTQGIFYLIRELRSTFFLPGIQLPGTALHHVPIMHAAVFTGVDAVARA